MTAVGTDERFTYQYDFGDSWEHEITVHRVWRMAKGLKFAVCLDGANACPEWRDGVSTQLRPQRADFDRQDDDVRGVL